MDSSNSKPKISIQAVIAVLGVMVVMCVVFMVFAPTVLPLNMTPAPTRLPPTLTSSTPSLESSSKLANTFTPIATSTILPTETPVPALKQLPLPTSTLINQSLPDLTVTGISEPKCVSDYRDTTTGGVVRLTFYVRNTGRVATRSFGPFDVQIYLIFGETYYPLDEWASQFNGVFGNTNLEIPNLNPNQGVTLNVVVGLKGNRTFGVEAVANSGENIIPETNMLNNKLRKYFTIYCY